MSAPRICIVSHAAFRALTGSTTGHIGGVEHQTSLLAKWLVARGYAVDFVTWREGEEAEAMVDGVRLLTVCRQDEGLPGLRFVFPRWTSLIAALRRSDADVYYHNTAECVTGQVGLWCRAANRRFVFSAASHADCDAALPCLPRLRERVLYRLGLRLASAAVVQTEMQRQMMQVNFARASEVIPMPCPEPDPRHVLQPSAGPLSTRALWVGRLSDLKRPELFLAAAQLAPGLQFDLVGPLDGDEYGNRILEQAKRIPNVTYHGPVARADMARLYQQSGCLVCTSHLEGFPNTFLEAWSQGLPVVSTWDPDDSDSSPRPGRGLRRHAVRGCAGHPVARRLGRRLERRVRAGALVLPGHAPARFDVQSVRARARRRRRGSRARAGGRGSSVEFHVMIRSLHPGPIPRDSWRRFVCHPDPDCLVSLAASFSEAGPADAARLSRDFSEVVSSIRIGRTHKLTRPNRLAGPTGALCDRLQSPARDTLQFLDVGASDGITTLEAVRMLEARLERPVSACLIDPFIRLVRYRSGSTVEYPDPRPVAGDGSRRPNRPSVVQRRDDSRSALSRPRPLVSGPDRREAVDAS